MSLNIEACIDELRMALDCDRHVGEMRTRILTISLSKVMAYVLPLPTSRTTDLRSYYQTNCKPEVDRILCMVNERELVNINQAQALIEGLFTFRYRMVFEPCHPALDALLDSMMAGESLEIAGQYKELLADQRYRESVGYLTSRIWKDAQTKPENADGSE